MLIAQNRKAKLLLRLRLLRGWVVCKMCFAFHRWRKVLHEPDVGLPSVAIFFTLFYRFPLVGAGLCYHWFGLGNGQISPAMDVFCLRDSVRIFDLGGPSLRAAYGQFFLAWVFSFPRNAAMGF